MFRNSFRPAFECFPPHFVAVLTGLDELGLDELGLDGLGLAVILFVILFVMFRDVFSHYQGKKIDGKLGKTAESENA